MLRTLTVCFLLTSVFSVMNLYTAAKHTRQYYCGPNDVCTCYGKPSNKHNVTMDCSGKSLANLSQICDSLGNATRLDVSSNEIAGTIIDVDVNGCEKLLFLSLRNNTVTGIARSVFTKLHGMLELDLSCNRLPVYAGKSTLHFADLVKLETLKINGNPVSYYPTSPRYPDLTTNTHLTNLCTDGLRNDNTPFPALTSLKILVISGFDGTCDIENIDDSFFASLSQLETLDLSFCKLEEISLNAFTQLMNLKWLDLSNNRRLGIRSLFNVSHALQYTQIHFLNMSYISNTFGSCEQVKKVDVCFLKNTTLNELALDGNRIHIVETNALQLFPISLRILHANDNHFTFGNYLLQLACVQGLRDFNGAFQNSYHDPRKASSEPMPSNKSVLYNADCPFMKVANLRNICKTIPNCNFLNDRFRTIKLYPPSLPLNMSKIIYNDGNMKYSPLHFTVFPLLNKVEHIDLSGNIFKTLSGSFGPFYNLKYFDISRAYCSQIQRHFFEYTPFIENLQLHSNLIGLYWTNGRSVHAFHNLTKLKVMNLTMNKITYIHPQTFNGLTNLKTLDLSDNSIDIWTLNANSLSDLTHVNLTNNALQSLPVSLMEHLIEVSKRQKTNFTINLSRNPLKYGCQTKDFLFWMIDHRKSFVEFDEYMFVDEHGSPIAISNIEAKVKELKKKCQSNVIWIVLSCIGVSVALSVILFGLVYRNRWKIRYLMYMTKHRFYGYVKIPGYDPVENYKYDAFISYEDGSIRFVKDHLIPKIEHNGVSLCVHQRDFLPGNAIADNIVDAIQSSRKTVILLTKAFLKSKWCMYEFNMARMENIYSRDDRGCVVMVLLEDVPAKLMPPELINWMKTESYLEYTTNPDGETLFWNNLADALS